MSEHRLTRLDRRWRKRHARHGTVQTSYLTAPSFDRSARGVLMVCGCGKVRAR